MGVLYKEKKITYDILDENPLENVFDNKDNSYLAIRTVSWNKSSPKLEVRRWYIDDENNESPSKGITFSTEEGPHQLTHLLLKLGYGDDNVIDSIMKNRKANNKKSVTTNDKNEKCIDSNKIENKNSEEITIRKEKSNKFSAKNLMENISTNVE